MTPQDEAFGSRTFLAPPLCATFLVPWQHAKSVNFGDRAGCTRIQSFNPSMPCPHVCPLAVN